MVGAGLLMIGLALYGSVSGDGRYARKPPTSLADFQFGRLLLPYIANAAGWIMTEMGRVPWVVYGLMKMEDGVSPLLPAGRCCSACLIGYTGLYGALMVATVYLMIKYARAGLQRASAHRLARRPERCPPWLARRITGTEATAWISIQFGLS